MKEKYINICKEIEAHLKDDMESNAKKLLERDLLLQTEMDTFEKTLSTEQVDHWTTIRNQVDNMRMYAKLGKIRLMEGDDSLSKLVSDYQAELEGTDIRDEAAIEITQEMHEPSGIVGIFKSLFMWKDTPEERIKKNLDK
ncbi:MAG: hypothetical protein ACSHX6_13860 [Akkermansiaceae bacterium]